MYQCPSCAGRSITFMHKWLASSAAPARCNRCGCGSAIAIVDASGTLVAATLLITASGFVAAAVNAVYPLALGAVLAVAYYFWRQHRAQLRIVPQQETATAKRSGWVAFLALIFQGFLS
jgi:4-hydroxybenzoate polyprenyltransferase